MVFRAEAVTPFPAETRKRPLYFPYRWQELDQVTLTIPEGYELESPTAPAAVPAETLRYRVTMAFDEPTRSLKAQREFMSNVAFVAVEQYPPLRKFYDHVVRSDQHELVLRKKSASAAK